VVRKLVSYIKVTIRDIFLICFTCAFTVFLTVFRPGAVSRLIDEGFILQSYSAVLLWTCFICILSVGDYVSQMIQISVFTKLENLFTENMYQASLEKIMKIPLNQVQNRNVAELLNTVENDISRMTILVNRNTIIYFDCLFQIVGGIAGVFLLDYRMAFAVLFIIPIKQLLVVFMAKRKKELTRNYIELWRTFSTWFGNQIGGILEIKLWNLYEKKTGEMKETYREIPHVNWKIQIWDGLEDISGQLIGLALEVVVYVGCGYLACEGKMSVGNILAFLTYTTYVSGPLSCLTRIPYLWADVKPSLERYMTLMETEEEKLAGDEEIKKKQGIYLKMEKVAFGYSEEKTILENIDLSVCRGEKIAVIGDNGAGKTTLISLLLGLDVPSKGEISMGGNSMETMGLSEWRKKFALVSQRPYLFQGTLKDNVDLEGVHTEQEIETIAEHYGLEFVLDKIENGLHYQIENNGTNLSGGEQQKITFLRALMKDAEIVILDEATSNCDVTSRKVLRQVVLDDSFEKTVIIISHYREDVSGVDCVYEIKNRSLIKIKYDDF
jgi:ATP-binding cassette subfamily B protein